MVDGDQWLLSDPANPQWHHAATNNVLPTGQQMHRVFHLTLALVCTFFACEPCKLRKSWPRHVTNSSDVPGRNHLRNCSAKQFVPCYPPQEKASAAYWRRSKPNSCNKTSELVDSIQETADLCVQLQEEEVSIQCSLQSAQPANLPSAS